MSVQDCEFLNCTVGSFGLLHLAHLPHVSLSNVTFLGHGTFGNVDIFTNTYNALPTDNPGLIPMSLNAVPLSTCLSIVNITYIDTLVVTGMRYEQWICLQGIYLSSCTNGSLTGLNPSENEGFNQMGSVLFLNFTDTLIISDFHLYSNRNSHPLGQGTTAVVGKSLTTHISNSQFEGNSATYGSSVFLHSTGSTTVAASHFVNNSATVGGAIGVELPTQQYVQFTLKDSEFRGNSAANFGGAVAVFRTIVDSSVPEDLIVPTYSCELTLLNALFVGNSAQDGAAVYMDCSSAKQPCALHFSTAVLSSNAAKSIVSLPFDQLKFFYASQLICSENAGTCLVLESTSGDCANCEFRRNQAVSGAAFHISSSNFTFRHSHFELNSVPTYGGAGFLESSTLACDFCLFINNSAGRLGGALYLHSSSLVLSASQFTSNSAHSGGFALQFYRCPVISYINATAFTRNYGSGIAVLSLFSANLSLSFCTFQGNAGARLTGGVHVSLSELKVYRGVTG